MTLRSASTSTSRRSLLHSRAGPARKGAPFLPPVRYSRLYERAGAPLAGRSYAPLAAGSTGDWTQEVATWLLRSAISRNTGCKDCTLQSTRHPTFITCPNVRTHRLLSTSIFAAWLECYLADCEARGVTARSLEWYRDRGGRLVSLLDGWGITRPEEINRAVVSRLIGAVRRQKRHGQPLQPQTVLGYWQVGKGFATFLIGEDALQGPNPFDLFGKPRVPQKSMWAPSSDECVALLRVPDRKTVQGLRDLSLLYLLLDCGLRVSAVTQIRLRDIDVPERKIWVVEKGRRERVVPFGVQALRWLRRYIAAARLQIDEPLFPGKDGRPISRKRVDEIVKSCARQAGVRRGSVSAHDLRRAFAREFLRNGGDMESLRQLLGHTSYAMVKRHAELASDVVSEKHRKSSPGDNLLV